MTTRKPNVDSRPQVRLACPDSRCRWTITTSQDKAEQAVADHLAVDARHTGGSWVDRDGRERVGFDYVSAESGRVER